MIAREEEEAWLEGYGEEEGEEKQQPMAHPMTGNAHKRKLDDDIVQD